MSEKSISDIIDEHEKMDLYNAIIDALSKQMPKAVVVKHQGQSKLIAYDTYETFDTTSYHCPICGTSLHDMFHKQKYCDNCGQKLKWEGL